jgi:hypothetical protein
MRRVFMKQAAWFLIVMCALSCGSAWADIVIYEEATYGTWGDVGGYLSEATSYRNVGEMVTSPVSGSLTYDLDGDGADDSFAGTEVGLWYAKGYVVVPDPLRQVEVGAHGIAYFTTDSEQLSLDWVLQRGGSSPYDFGMTWLLLTNWSHGPDILYEYFGPGSNEYSTTDEWSGTQMLTLDPTDLYRLEWHLEIDIAGAGWGPSDVWAQLDIGLAEVEAIPLPGAALLGVLGLGYAGIRLRRE